MTCSVDGCDKGGKMRRGLCNKHYIRLMKYGAPTDGGTEWGVPLAHLLAVAVAPETDQCSDWPYGMVGKYGCLRYQGRVRRASNVMCEIAHGIAPPDAYEAAHSCGRAICINPKHLRWATPKENSADAIGHGVTLRGHKHRRVKLTETQVHEIRRLRGSMSPREIGAIYGVSHRTIHSVFYGYSWKWLETAA